MSKYTVLCDWASVPHITPEAAAEMLSALPPHQRDARSKGLPMLGSGAIYPVAESAITVEDFAIPAHWRRCYGLDVGWNFTAGCWIAQDPDSLQAYIFSVYKAEKAEPAIHAAGIKARGEWIPGVIDPASSGANQLDGRRLIDLYVTAGLNLQFADNSVEAGIYRVWEMLSSGQLKVFASCVPWFKEYRNYNRDEKGRIVKEHDHIMDAMRYAVMSGMEIAKPKTPPVPKELDEFEAMGIYKGAMPGGSQAW